ncbi:MAG TPA: PQQ-binding-like beta-propeller repeat protein, partial [Acidimicrobiales bacterium]|nr:PQQ-binding-like beta-propeller repeat protein [Acidimicrobiales bacterium]
TGNPATTFNVTNDGSLTATAPTGTGTVDVTVTTSGGTSAVSQPADQFTYTTGPPPPTEATYRGDIGKSGYYPNETGLTTSNVATLKVHWTAPGGIDVFSQPIITNNMVYWADWTGNEHGTDLSGHDVWKTSIGTTTPPSSDHCSPTTSGPTATATIASQGSTLVDYVGGGNGVMYALNADTGAIIWQTRLGSSPDNFLWDSPVVYNNVVYMGVASYGDCPLVQGKLIALDAATGSILHTAIMVPNGCIGGGIWGSPTVDSSAGTVWVTTGTPHSCNTAGALAPSIVELRASDLAILGSWTTPVSSQSAGDPDFGTTPTLFTATIGGKKRLLVGAANKDGIFYALDRTNPGGGPVWQATLATPSGDPAKGSIISAAWDGTYVYAAGGNATVNGTSCAGTVDALNPATGGFVWRSCQANHMFAGITVVPGVVVEGTLGGNVEFLNAANGNTLRSYSTGVSEVQGESTVANGVVYVPLDNGNLLALGQ